MGSLDYFKKSLLASDLNNLQKELSFEAAGNYYFDKAQFATAGAYYDSVLQVSTDSLDIRIRRVKRKYRNLASLIKFEEVVATNDSIVRIDKSFYFEPFRLFTILLKPVAFEALTIR